MADRQPQSEAQECDPTPHKPSWREVAGNGAYAVPPYPHLQGEEVKMVARVRMQQLTRAAEEKDPLVTSFGRINRKVSTWSHAYMATVQGMGIPPQLEPLPERPRVQSTDSLLLLLEGPQEEIPMTSDSLTVFPQPREDPLALAAILSPRFGAQAEQPPLQIKSRGLDSESLPLGGRKLAPLQEEAARSLAAAAEAQAGHKGPQPAAKQWPPQPGPAPIPSYAARSRHWVDMVRRTPEFSEVRAEGLRSIGTINQTVWAPRQRTFLPLALFDKPDTSQRAAAGNRLGGAEALSKWIAMDGAASWEPCQVLSASLDGQHYLVEWRSNGKQKWVSGLNILFDGETEDDLQRRRAVASTERDKTESEMLRSLQLTRLPVDNGAAMPRWLRANIRERIGRLVGPFKVYAVRTENSKLRLGSGWTQDGRGGWIRHLGQPAEETVEALFREVTDGLVHTNNLVMFDSSMAMAAAAMPPSEQVETIHEIGKVQNNLRRSASEIIRTMEACGQHGLVRQRVRDLHKVSLLGSPFLAKALQAIHSYMQDIRQMDLFGIEDLQKPKSPKPPGSHQSSRSAQSSHELEGMLLLAFLDATEDHMMKSLKEISSRILSNLCNIVMDAADEEAAHLVRKGMQSSDLDVTAYGRLVSVANVVTHDVLRLLAAQSVTTYTDTVTMWADRNFSHPLFFTNLEEIGGKIDFNPPLETFTERLLAIMTSAVDTMNKTKALTMSDMMVWRPESGMPRFTVMLDKTLPTVLHMDGPLVTSAMTSIKETMDRSLRHLRGLLDSFREHDALLIGNNADALFLAQWRQHNGSRLEDWDEAVSWYRQEEEDIMANLPLQTNIGIYCIHCATLRRRLTSGAQRFAEVLLTELAREAFEIATECKEVLSKLHADVTKPTHNLEELHEILEKLNHYPGQVAEQQVKLEKVGARLQIIEKHKHHLDADKYSVVWEALALPGTIDEASAARRESIKVEEARYMEELKEARERFRREVVVLAEEVSKWHTMDDEDEASLYAIEVSKLAEVIQSHRKEAQVINRREALIRWEKTDYKQIEDLQKQLLPYVDLWALVSSFQAWTARWRYGPLFAFSLEQLDKQVPVWCKTVLKLEKALSGGPYRVVTTCKAQLEELQFYLPLMACLRTTVLRERHWKALYEITNMDESVDRRTWTMQTVIQLGFMDHMAGISQIADLAIKESVIEKVIDRIDQEFSLKEIDLQSHARKHVEVMFGGEDLLLALEDNILKLQALGMSPYSKPHKERVVYWEGTLKGIRTLVLLWLEVQNRWDRAELLLNNETTARQMPMEARRFAVIDTMWRNIVADTRNFPNLIEVSQRGGLLERLEDARQRLVQITKGMHEFLNLKRVQFPRFNFISDNELFAMLELSREPAEVEPYIDRVFPGISRLLVSPDKPRGDSITGIGSRGGETLSLAKGVRVKWSETGMAMEIDQWMSGIETSMKEALLTSIEGCIRGYGMGNYGDWLVENCGQAVLVVSSLVWSNEVAEILHRMKEETREEQGSRRERVTICGTRGSFITEAESHGIGTHPISRKMRKMQIVEEEDDGLLSPHEGQQMDSFSSNADEGSSSRPLALQSRPTRDGGPVGRKSTAPLPGETKQEKFGLQGEEETQPRTMVGSLTTAEMFRQLQGRMAAVLKELHRMMGGHVQPQHKQKISNLIIMKIYQRDIIDRLIKEQVENECDFEWLRQPLYEYQPDNRELKEQRKVSLLCMNMRVNYCCEYLGDHTRLITTPLTERAFNTLISAIHLHRGGSCEGPAGTGKTETVRELGKVTATLTVVSNCSEELDMTSILKILVGVASCGAWGCFDEFNRLGRGVLSVIAKYIHNIQIELAANSTKVSLAAGMAKGLTPMKRDMAIFITSNPSYMGRGELPVNLKSLFRPVAMMAPDFTVVAEVFLVAAGFERAKEAAEQIVGCLAIARQKLTHVEHYNFGMRVLKKVLLKCGELKQQSMEDRRQENAHVFEMLQCQRAMLRMVLPGLLPEDAAAFEGLVQSAFPVERGSRGDHLKVVNAMRKVVSEAKGIQISAHLIRHGVQLYDIMNMQTGVLLLGAAGCGKTMLRRVMMETLRELNKEDPDFDLIETTINPKAVSKDRLLGSMVHFHQWKDGILTAALREATRSKSTHWVVLDGHLDVEWMEDLNTLLDDSRVLSLPSGEAINLRNGVKVFFESDSVSSASPASIGRIGLLHMTSDPDGWKYVVAIWIKQSLPEALRPYANKFEVMISEFCEPLMHFLSFPGRTVLPQTNNAMIKSLLSLLDSQMAEQGPGAWKDHSSHDIIVLIECFTLFAILWSIGANCAKKERGEFSKLFHKLQKLELNYMQKTRGIEMVAHMKGVLVPLPEEAAVFEFYFDTETKTWQTWGSLAYLQPTPRVLRSGSMLVPTAESVAQLKVLDLFFLRPNSHMMLFGPAGSGKTLLVESFLQRKHRQLAAPVDAGDDLKAASKEGDRGVLSNLGLGILHQSHSISDLRLATPEAEGPTGRIHSDIPETKVFAMRLLLSSGSDASYVQSSIEGKLEKQAKGVYAPPRGLPGVVFVDDMGTASRNSSTNTGPTELLRQWIENGGWYEAEEAIFRSLRGLQLMGCFTTGLAGQLSTRLLRHCHLVGVPQLSSASHARIFKVIMENGLAGADVDILTEATNLAQASCAVLREVSLRLLPVPSRPHYRYTVRDMARVFQSVLGASSPCRASPRRLATLWYHEVLRVLYDRLLDADLQKWFMAMLAGVISSHDISLDTKRLGDVDGQEVLFCNFIRQRGEEYTAVIPFSDGYEEEGTGLAPREATEVQPTADEPEETLPLKEESRAGGRPRPKETSARKRRKRVTSTRKLEQTEVAEEGGEVKKAGAGGDKEAPSPAEASLFHSPEMTREEVMQRSAELRRKLLSAEDGSHTGPLLAELIDCYQIEYCYANPKQPLSLIMFRAATSHVARVARAVSQARNNLLLLGSAASAVRTVARFAAFLADLQAVEVTMQPDYTVDKWHSDVKTAMKSAGLQDQGTVLIFKDSEHFPRQMIDDVVHLLVNREVKGLFTQDEVELVVANISPAYVSKLTAEERSMETGHVSEAEYMEFFFDRCRANLRILLIMEPRSKHFTSRLQEFPQIVTSCNSCFVSPWDEASLNHIAEKVFARSDILREGGKYAGYLDKIISSSVSIHLDMQAAGEAYRRVQSGYEVGNTEFLEMLHQVPMLIGRMESNVKEQNDKYLEGINNMTDLSTSIMKLEEALISIQPAVQASSDETDRLLQRVHSEQYEASVMRSQLEVEEKAEARAAEEAQFLRDQCNADLEASMPPLRRVLKELQSINKNDIAELKSLKSPPMGVKFVMKAVCHMLGCIPQPVLDRRQLDAEIEDALWWRESMKLLGQLNFTDILLTFDKNSIPDDVINQIGYFTSLPEFNPKAISKVSKAATCLCRWVLAIDLYHDTKKIIIPKTEALKRAEDQVVEKRARLDGKRKTLGTIQSNLDDLRFKYESALAHRDQLQKDLRHATEKVERARTVLKALRHERSRWEGSLRMLLEKVEQAVGNAVLSAAYVAYAGGLDSTFRASALEHWKSSLRSTGIVHNRGFDFSSAVGDDAQISDWLDAGLPNSKNAIESAIIMDLSRRWPLVIDPQEQAIAWLRKLHSNQNLIQLLTPSKDFHLTLGLAIEKGYRVIIGNVGKDYSSAVDHLIDRRVFYNRQGHLCLQLGDKAMPFDPNFRTLLWTRRTPAPFSPDAVAKTAAINFSITKEQLIDELVHITLRFENPDMDKERHDLRRTKARYNAALIDIEQGILNAIASKDAVAILESPVVHRMLSEAQEAATDLKTRLSKVENMEKRISAVRVQYEDGIAARAAILYFAVKDLANINYAYQFSLRWFCEVYAQALRTCPRSLKLDERMAALRPHFTQLLYTATCYSLFDKDKMPFALTMALRLMRHSGSISEGEVNFLVNGRVNDQQDNIPGSTSHLRPQDPGDETDRQEL